MKTLGRPALGIGVVLLIGLLASVLLFLYALLFAGPWLPFFWAAGFSLALVAAIKLLALGVLDDERQLLVAGMLSELLGGTFGWTWMALAGASLVLFFKALFFGGAWSNFFLCLLASGACKWLTRYSMTTKEAAMFKRELVEKGMTKEEAREVWIARAREMIQRRNLPASDRRQ
ncbi:MAG TPA: hypothetical protein DDZ42_22855 [Candidatus Rokubacteria bacterium]|nr:MAG: hypothetical protein A2050_14650 [Candidatus Rokubacteria bacterium GWA2_73_35]HAM57173.1 hypothetical protein [Candidatus Rokubacteria bacterium]HBH04718.1 hypothetical protein [Candidatus Rokubacteria bacterium]